MIKNVGYSINIDDSTKKQALKVFELLHKEYEDVIQRAFMRIQIICDDFIKNDVIKLLNDNNAIIEEDKMTNNIKREDELNQNCDTIHKENMSDHDMKNDEINNLKDQKQSNLSSSIQLNNNENDPKKNNHGFSYNNKTEVVNETASDTSNGILDDTKDKDEAQVNEDKHKDTMNKNNFNDDPNNHTISAYKKGTSNNENSETNEEKLDSNKKKKNQDNFPIDNEKTNKEKFTDNSKIKTKQKINKHNAERKGDNLQTYKIVFLCYPSLYRCIDEFTKKNKRNCSSKILSNNVKVATSNKRAIGP